MRSSSRPQCACDGNHVFVGASHTQDEEWEEFHDSLTESGNAQGVPCYTYRLRLNFNELNVAN